MYHITIQDVVSGIISVTNAEIVVSAVGPLKEPQYPHDLEGLSDYKGEMFHSARWNHGLDLHGKRVAVIGNGCSAYVACIIRCHLISHSFLVLSTQFVPLITEDPTTEVTQFCRTPSWFIPHVSGHNYAE
jgi:cation diffusion facilitator CzcD-associated flavoprotein CzcO